MVALRFAFHFHTFVCNNYLSFYFAIYQGLLYSQSIVRIFIYPQRIAYVDVHYVCFRHSRLIFSLLQSIFYNAITRNIPGNGEKLSRGRKVLFCFRRVNINRGRTFAIADNMYEPSRMRVM